MWRVLVAHFTPRPKAVRLTTDQHLQALTEVRGAEVLSYNAVYGLPAWLRHLEFDAVVLHTTLLGMRWNPYFEQWKTRTEWLGEIDALKIAFPQDEYWHAETLDTWLDELGVSVVCSVLDDTHRNELYPRLSSKAAFYETLTGYIDDASAERFRSTLVPIAERPHDLVYRARNLPYWLGSHGQLKHRIGEAAAALAPAYGLTADVSTRLHETVLGDAWLAFMGSGRATLGAESGSSTLDRHGELQAKVDELVGANPGMSFAELDALMPPGWDDYRFFAISPRHLEAVVTKTAQILVEGRYSGALEAEQHYLPVARDLSNLDEALERARDPQLLAQLTERAYEDVYRSGRFSGRRLTETLERILEEHGSRRPGRRRPLGLSARIAHAEEEVERVAVGPLLNVLRSGREGHRDALAGLRLLATDAGARRLLLDYAGSTETREHVSPRVALAELRALSDLRRGGLSVEVDMARRQLVLGTGGARASRDELERLLASGAWEFLSDAGGAPRPLTVLSWLARSSPRDVAAALARG